MKENESKLLSKEEIDNILTVKDNDTDYIGCDIKFWKEHEDAKTPNVAYNGTSACFDLYSIEDKTIFPGESAKVENGIRIVVPKGYYIRFCTRSGHGFMEDLFVYHGLS